MKTMKFKPAEVAEAIREANGFITYAARRLGCNPMTVSRYIARYEIFKSAYEEAQNAMKDFAESQLYKLIAEGNTAAIIFYLKTKARDRGYSERIDINPDGIRIELRWADKPEDGNADV